MFKLIQDINAHSSQFQTSGIQSKIRSGVTASEDKLKKFSSLKPDELIAVTASAIYPRLPFNY